MTEWTYLGGEEVGGEVRGATSAHLVGVSMLIQTHQVGRRTYAVRSSEEGE